MRTVLYEICLFNDVGHKLGSYFYMKRKEGEREQDARETERECVWEGGWLQEKVASVVKMTAEENRPFRIRIGLKR
jgi:hypothetical protein